MKVKPGDRVRILFNAVGLAGDDRGKEVTITYVGTSGSPAFYTRNGSDIPLHTGELSNSTEFEMVNTKAIGYKAPIDLWGTTIPAGTLYKATSSVKPTTYCAVGSNGLVLDSGRTNLPKEIVETWEPVYEATIITKTVSIGKRNVYIDSKQSIVGTRSYTIDHWERLLKQVKLPWELQCKDAAPAYVVNIETFSIGCEKDVTIGQIEHLIDTYYELNPKT